MITHGRTGFLVNPERPDEIAECMKRLIEDTGLRKRMSSNCLKDIRKFEWKNVISRLEREVYPLFAKHG
jgi:glycosyltransferase involved in cell wall biosynthesis